MFTPLGAADWKLFYRIEQGSQKYYFDKESIVRPRKDIVQVWQKIADAQDEENEIEKSKTHIEINCRSKSYKVLDEEKSENTGEGVNAQNHLTTKRSQHIAWDSAIGVLWTNVCP
jgi:acetyl-CoA carboxylase beta subunit